MLYKPLGRGNDTAQHEEASHRHDHLHGGIRSGNDADALAAVEDAAADTDAGRAFRDQFVGMSGTVSVAKDGGEVDALTGATITSRAVCKGVNAALACAANLG